MVSQPGAGVEIAFEPSQHRARKTKRRLPRVAIFWGMQHQQPGWATPTVARPMTSSRTITPVTPTDRNQQRTNLKSPVGRAFRESALNRCPFMVRRRREKSENALSPGKARRLEIQARGHRVNGECCLPNRLPLVARHQRREAARTDQ